MMPEMDGLEVVQAIRKVNTELPIIAISGGMRHAAINFVTFAQEFGANVIFKKPVALSDLLKSVQQLFTNSKSLILY
jgi:CheY-like chemotaxis protein